AAGALLLERLAGPRDLVTARQYAPGDVLDGPDRVARADPWLAGSEHLRGDVAVEALELFGADHAARGDQGLQRDHLAARCRAHEHVAEVVRPGAERRVGLHLHAIGPPELVEVVDVQRAHRALQRLEDLLHRDAERERLLAVDLDLQLRPGRPVEAVDALQPR